MSPRPPRPVCAAAFTARSHGPRAARVALPAVAAVLATASLVPAALRAQGADSVGAAVRPAAAAPVPQPYRYTLAANPLLPLLSVVSAEAEVALPNARGITLGVGGLADLGSGRDRFNTVQAKLKYYPNEVALRGFSVGVTLGVVSARTEAEEGFFFEEPERSESGATYGVVLDYNWLIGRQRRFLVGAGFGVRRVLPRVSSNGPLEQVLPDGRLTIGWAF